MNDHSLEGQLLSPHFVSQNVLDDATKAVVALVIVRSWLLLVPLLIHLKEKL
eukprot:c7977_g1_i1 orf=95-250(+)